MEGEPGYAAVLAERPVFRLLLASLGGRVAFSMLPLGIVLFATAETRSTETAGVLLAAFSVTSAFAPVRGRIVDRHGPRALIAFAAVCAAGIAALALAGHAGAPAEALVVLGALAGATVPPLGPFTRAVWVASLPDGSEGRQRVFALDASGEEAALIVAPLVVALAVAAGSPAAALLVAATGLLLGTVAAGRSGLTRRLVPPGPSRIAARTPLPAPLWFAIASLLGPGAALGAFGVTVAAIARAEGSPARAGLLQAALAVGTAGASLVAGRRRWSWTATLRLGVFEAALAAAFVVAALAAPWPLALGAVLVFVGMAVGGLFVTLYLLVAELAPPGVGTRVYAWLITANNGGLALGAGLAGALVASRGPAAGLWLGAGFAAVGAIGAFAARSRS